MAAASEMISAGAAPGDVRNRLFGIDVHQDSLDRTRALLSAEGLVAQLLQGDFFKESPPGAKDARVPQVDAVLGNPPFVRFHSHKGLDRARSTAAAASQDVELSGLSSSWAATLVHASAFLKPEGRLAMVVPAELFTVDYAEPIRKWLHRRFARVHLVLFENLQFNNVAEQVVLLVAGGTGGTRSFVIHRVRSGEDLPDLHAYDGDGVQAPETGKWTDLLVPAETYRLFERIADHHFVGLGSYARLELGTVTGANHFFTLTEGTREEYELQPGVHVVPTLPPGGRFLRGLRFAVEDWNRLRDEGQRVWLLNPTVDERDPALGRYLAHGRSLEVELAYKCMRRKPWWRPRMVTPPPLYATYMSHLTPRLIQNTARAAMVNSTHAVQLKSDAPPTVAEALPLLAMNSLSMLGAEIFGRSYGGGVLKMELREMARFPVPNPETLTMVWKHLEPRAEELESRLRAGDWRSCVEEVDYLMLGTSLGLNPTQINLLRVATDHLRQRRTGKSPSSFELREDGPIAHGDSS